MISIPTAEDGARIHAINTNTTVFSPEEVQCVDELWGEFLAKGAERSGYYFQVYKTGEGLLGYTCYGPRALTSGTFDLYWIAVDPAARGGGIGKILVRSCEDAVLKLGGRLLVLETSGLPSYEPTRKFYLSIGYTQEAVLKDFYHVGDDLVIFTKHL